MLMVPRRTAIAASGKANLRIPSTRLVKQNESDASARSPKAASGQSPTEHPAISSVNASDKHSCSTSISTKHQQRKGGRRGRR
ncbi:unnamed protein product [Protopolystoma xenopodis]|uniref:Uncharacterized protein n=1 Tax=Protopolystoma xenopodis TaxID=117903 RepID=A0A3S5BNC3_9PLAT|nr:unnamed protein product [Protopolystoma xenopodis]